METEIKQVISQTEQDSDEEVAVIGEASDGEEEASDGEEEASDDDQDRIPIDLSQNEVYRGVCTLFEDDEGNNILEYISLLHTELIGINKSLENLKNIRKDITRLADCAEFYVKSTMSAEEPKHSSSKSSTSKQSSSKKH